MSAANIASVAIVAAVARTWRGRRRARAPLAEGTASMSRQFTTGFVNRPAVAMPQAHKVDLDAPLLGAACPARLRCGDADAQAHERRGLLRAARGPPAAASRGAAEAEPRSRSAGARGAQMEPAGVRARREDDAVDAAELQPP